jgi:hypothetical protein
MEKMIEKGELIPLIFNILDMLDKFDTVQSYKR